MTDTLVFMRHAKAKTYVEGQSDFERDLSEAGKRSLAATLGEQIAPMRGFKGTVTIWSSPANRALQTAELLAKALKSSGIKVAGEIELVQELWDQDFDGVMAQVESCDSNMVVLVGHNPFIEESCRRLTGSSIRFSTGGMAAISLVDLSGRVGSSADDGQKRLLWYAQGPVSQRWKTLVQMEKILAKGADNVKSRLDSFLSEPSDIETMHKFRVSIRTLRSLVAFVKPWQDAAQNDEMNQNLKAIVAQTSRLRELDVFAEQAKESTAGSDELVAFCENEAAIERNRVYEFLSGKQATKHLDRVCRCTRNLQWKRKYLKNGLPACDIRARFDKLASQLELELAMLDLAEVEHTHDVRKRAKRVRYVAENYKGFIGEDAVGIAKGMTKHQDNLGAVCDARVNIDIINGYADRDIPEAVAWDLALLRAQNEMYLYTTLKDNQQAMSEANAAADGDSAASEAAETGEAAEAEAAGETTGEAADAKAEAAEVITAEAVTTEAVETAEAEAGEADEVPDEAEASEVADEAGDAHNGAETEPSAVDTQSENA